MPTKNLLMLVTIACTLLMLATLYRITLAPEVDPCSDQIGMSAAAIADEGQDQENLVDRALLNKGRCKPVDNPDLKTGNDEVP